MRVYLPEPEEGFELCHPKHPSDFEVLITQLNGQSRRSTWIPIPMEIVHDDEGIRLERADSPWLGSHAMILRQDAAALVAPALSEWGELLPLACSEAPLLVYNPTHVVDALDEEASDLDRFSSGRIMMITRYVFRSDRIGSSTVFKIPELRSSPTFFTEPLKRDWTAAGIRGVHFRLVWEG